MSDDPIQDAIDEANASAGVEETEEFDDSGADEAPEVVEGDEESQPAPLLLGKFKSADDLAKAYEELQREFHARNQQPQEEYEEDDSEPFWMPGYTTEEAQRLAEYALASPQNAQQAFQYAESHPGEFGVDHDRITNELFQLWQAQDPLGSQRFLIQGMMEQQRAALQAEFEPLQEQYSQQAIDLAVSSAASSLPGFDERAQKVLEHIQNTPGLVESINANPAYKSPQAMTGLLKQAYANVLLEEYMQQMQNQPNAEQADSKPNTKPRTASRSTAAKPATDNVFDEVFGEGAFVELP